MILVFPRLYGASTLEMFESVQPHMGTLVRIQLYVTGAARADTAFHAAFARIAQLDATLSDYLPESEVNRLCRSAAGRPVPISPDLFRVLSAGRRLSEETDGAFDVTLGPVTGLWRQARQQRRLPDPDTLRVAMQRTGYRKLHLDAATGTATLDEPGMQLDLGGLGKGYAAGEALAVLFELGIRRALISVSGDLAIGDPPPGRQGWSIGAGSPGRVVILCNIAISTSGDASQNLEAGGVRYSHIIDPAGGIGLTRRITVTVVAPHGIDADSWSTALSVLGPERGLPLLEKHPDIAGLFIAGGGVVESAAWARLQYSRAPL